MSMVQVKTLKQSEQNRLFADLRHSVKFLDNNNSTLSEFESALRLVLKYGHYRLNEKDKLTVYFKVTTYLRDVYLAS